MVLINTSNEERTVRLVLGPTSAEARLAQNATLAVEVERKYVPGNDPRKTPAPLVARLYVPDGGVAWQDANGATTVDKASEWTIADGVPTAVVASTSPPAWIDQEVGGPNERAALRGAGDRDRPGVESAGRRAAIGIVSGQRAARGEVARGPERDARGTVRAVHRSTAGFGAAAELGHADSIAPVGDGA